MIEFRLPDMTCGHCASTVTRALQEVDPVCDIRIDLDAQTVRVRSGADRASLAEALTDAGYAPA